MSQPSLLVHANRFKARYLQAGSIDGASEVGDSVVEAIASEWGPIPNSSPTVDLRRDFSLNLAFTWTRDWKCTDILGGERGEHGSTGVSWDWAGKIGPVVGCYDLWTLKGCSMGSGLGAPIELTTIPSGASATDHVTAISVDGLGTHDFSFDSSVTLTPEIFGNVSHGASMARIFNPSGDTNQLLFFVQGDFKIEGMLASPGVGGATVGLFYVYSDDYDTSGLDFPDYQSFSGTAGDYHGVPLKYSIFYSNRTFDCVGDTPSGSMTDELSDVSLSVAIA